MAVTKNTIAAAEVYIYCYNKALPYFLMPAQSLFHISYSYNRHCDLLANSTSVLSLNIENYYEQ